MVYSGVYLTDITFELLLTAVTYLITRCRCTYWMRKRLRFDRRCTHHLQRILFASVHTTDWHCDKHLPSLMPGRPDSNKSPPRHLLIRAVPVPEQKKHSPSAHGIRPCAVGAWGGGFFFLPSFLPFHVRVSVSFALTIFSDYLYRVRRREDLGHRTPGTWNRCTSGGKYALYVRSTPYVIKIVVTEDKH